VIEPASTAVVTGAGGQDGFYLVVRLLADGCSVHATIRPGAPQTDLKALRNADRLTIHELDAIDGDAMVEFLAYHAVRADLLRKLGRNKEALHAYRAAIDLVTTSAERLWLTERRDSLAGVSTIVRAHR